MENELTLAQTQLAEAIAAKVLVDDQLLSVTQELEVATSQLITVAEAQRLAEEQLLRANETINTLTIEATRLSDMVQAFETFYAERDVERTDLLTAHEDISDRLVVTEKTARLANEALEDLKVSSALAIQAITKDKDALLKENGVVNQRLFDTEQSLIVANHELEIAKDTATESAASIESERESISDEFGRVRSALTAAEEGLAEKAAGLSVAIAQSATLGNENVELRQALTNVEEQRAAAADAAKAAKLEASDREREAGDVRLELEAAQAEIGELKNHRKQNESQGVANNET